MRDTYVWPQRRGRRKHFVFAQLNSFFCTSVGLAGCDLLVCRKRHAGFAFSSSSISSDAGNAENEDSKSHDIQLYPDFT